MKIILILLWLGISSLYLLGNLPNIQFLGLRLNLWIQMNICAFILSTTGAMLQNILKNPIADPWILGVTGVSSLSIVIVTVLQLSPILFWRTAGSLLGSGLIIFVLLIIAKRSKSLEFSKFILIGLGINSFCSALIIFLQNLSRPNDFVSSVIRISGHFTQRSSIEIGMLFIALILLTRYLYQRHRELSILNTGNDLALSIGVPVTQVKIETLIISSISLAVSVSIAGNIGFVGLATPHIIRMIFGEKEVLSPEILFCTAGIMMMIAALLLRIIPHGIFVPIGTAIALLGAPLFIYILIRTSTN
ncbi:MAG: FecCD family ABC transporter permease [Brevinema sp.]